MSMKRRFRTSRGFIRFILIFALASLFIHPVTSQAVSANPTPDCSAGTTCTITFTFTGDYYSWTVPSGVTSVTFDVQGAQGGTSLETYAPATGGLGGRVIGTLAVSGGSVYHIYVGGQPSASSSTAGFNGGGLGGVATGGLRPGARGGAS